MAEDSQANVNKLIWWILGISASMGVLLVSLTISKFESLDRRLRDVELVQEVGKEYARQLHELVSIIRTDQVDKSTRLGEINIKITALDFRVGALVEQQAILHHLITKNALKGEP